MLQIDGHNKSRALVLHEMAFNLLTSYFGTRFKTYRKTPLLQMDPEDLPALGVYLLRERRTASGDANHSAPKFQCEMTMGYWGAIHAATQDQNKIYDLERWMHEADEVLLSDPVFVMKGEGVESMERRTEYTKQGETTMVEIRTEMVVCFESNFPPRVPHYLETVHVQTQFPDKAHVESGTPQIEREYTFVAS